MAVRPNWYLTIAWRKSSGSGANQECVEVARYERSASAGPSAEDSAPPPEALSEEPRGALFYG